MLYELVALLFVLLLLAGVPLLSFWTARRSEIRLLPRRVLYLSAVSSQWMLAILGAMVVIATRRSFSQVGFRAISGPLLLRWTILLTTISLAGLGIVLALERRGKWTPESDLVYLLIPATRQEKLWAVMLVAPSAGFCEEFLYRGYLLAQLSQWTHSAAWACALSSLAFGLAHSYQRLNGMVRAALLGAMLAYPVVRYGSLYPSMAAHFLIDAVALVWLGPRFLRREPSVAEPEGGPNPQGLPLQHEADDSESARKSPHTGDNEKT